MSTKRIKASAFDQFRAVLDERGVTYEVTDNGTMIVGLTDGMQIIYPKGWDEVGSVMIECDLNAIRNIDVKTLKAPTAGRTVPNA